MSASTSTGCSRARRVGAAPASASAASCSSAARRRAAGGQISAGPRRARGPFSGKPMSLYVPAGASWKVAAETDARACVCSSPGAGGRPARRDRARTSHRQTRGKGNNIRYVTDIITESDPADSLLVVEVITPGGQLLRATRRTSTTATASRGDAARGGLLPPPQPAAGLRLPAHLHRRPLARRGDDGRGRRRDAGAARLPPLRRRSTATTSTTSTSWPARSASGASTTTPRTVGCWPDEGDQRDEPEPDISRSIISRHRG